MIRQVVVGIVLLLWRDLRRLPLLGVCVLGQVLQVLVWLSLISSVSRMLSFLLESISTPFYLSALSVA